MPSCVGHSCAYIKQDKEKRERNTIVFNGDWIYQQCKKEDGIPSVEGTYFRQGLKILQDQGAVPALGGDPTPYKIGNYVIIDKLTAEEIKKAIFLYGSVLAGFRGTNEGWRGEVIRKPAEGEKIWGHAVCLIGYDQDYFYGINSWGINAHAKGIFKVPFRDYMPFEAWFVINDLPNVATGTIGYIAKEYILDGKTTKRVNFRVVAGMTGKVIRVLAANTPVRIVENSEVNKDDLIWVQAEVA